MKRVIRFRAAERLQELAYPAPTPAIKTLPRWYKKMPLRRGVHDKGFTTDHYGKPDLDLTAKSCVPLFDAMSLGYQIVLPTDICVKTAGDGSMAFAWHFDARFIGQHAKDQIAGMPNPVEGGSGQPFKWNLGWHIDVPDGYSVLYTHPLNRWDLPFRTFSGVVDEDQYLQATQFPFQLVVDLPPSTELIINAGTPVVQFLPFKRENWKSVRDAYDPAQTEASDFKTRSTWWRGYKNKVWNRKSYE